MAGAVAVGAQGRAMVKETLPHASLLSPRFRPRFLGPGENGKIESARGSGWLGLSEHGE